MSNYKILRGSHARFENGVAVRYAKNDVIDLTDKEAATFLEGRIIETDEPVRRAADNPEPVAEKETKEPRFKKVAVVDHTEAVAEALDGNVNQARKAIATAKNPAFLEALIATETAGKGRAGILTAAQERLEELNQ